MATQDDYPEQDFPLPEWAARRSDGSYMELGAQLSTRDGRRMGNAYVDDLQQHDDIGPLAVVVTDMGNTFRMTIRELEEVFYPPAYVMLLSEARAKRGVMPNTEKLELERLRAKNSELCRLLIRYRDETPLGNQPHMIAHQTDEALGRG